MLRTKISTPELTKISDTTISGNGHLNKKHTFMESIALDHTNKVMGLVYIGAAFLIIIVGLRGLGSIVGDISMIPGFLVDAKSGKIDSNWVIFALFLEFFMLVLLSTVTFFTPQEEKKKSMASLEEFREGIKEIKSFTEEELKVMKSYIDEFEHMSGKISQVHTANVEALKKMSDILKK